MAGNDNIKELKVYLKATGMRTNATMGRDKTPLPPIKTKLKSQHLWTAVLDLLGLVSLSR